MRSRDERRRRREERMRALAERMWSAPPPRPDRPLAGVGCCCPHLWRRTRFVHGMEIEQQTKTYGCRACGCRLVRIADGLRDGEPELYCDTQGSFLPCAWDGCIQGHRSRWLKIADGVRAQIWRGDAHQVW
jgi:hypothetical protein